ncbi:MAG: class I mannose-6-phosphate isomerase [Clostridia bacterium]|nr:class I mannose-6-phosphate isomerase [Clostridia bacterium]
MSNNSRFDPIVKLKPVFKDYIWGGTKLRDIYHKKSDYDIIAESWEISTHRDGNSTIASGEYRGISFAKYLDVIGTAALGRKFNSSKGFPFLIKLIDANQNLSVQVHPNDEYALQHENDFGKTEMWYVIDAEPGAGLYVGFNRDVSRDEVEERIANNTIIDILCFHPTKAGDVFFIPAGTVHTIGAGNLIYEIQQSSNSTYRLYDYNRKDKFGNLRELHLEKALDVLDYSEYKPIEFNGKISCQYFEVGFIEVNGLRKICITDDTFNTLTCLKGNGSLSIEDFKIEVNAGDSFFIPACNTILSVNGKFKLAIDKL